MAKGSKTKSGIVALVVAVCPAGYKLVEKREGLGQPGQQVQKAYADPYLGWRVPTICYGHTYRVKQGDTATIEQCRKWLEEDATKHCAIVYEALVPLNIWLTQGEQDAYCSFAYNVGRFKNTDSIYGRLVKQDDWGACMGLLKYYYSDGVPSRGLWNRRYDEYNECISQLEHRREGIR